MEASRPRVAQMVPYMIKHYDKTLIHVLNCEFLPEGLTIKTCEL